MRLTSLLRGVLRSEGEFTTLGRELDVIESYLDIERARFEHRLRVTIDVPAQPATASACRRSCCSRSSKTRSNTASRHVSPAARSPCARRSMAQFRTRASCRLVVHDTGSWCDRRRAASVDGRRASGLRNVERRLACQYGDAASLSIHTAPGEGTTVEIRLPVESRSAISEEQHSWQRCDRPPPRRRRRR